MACRLFGLHFSAWPVDELTSSLQDNGGLPAKRKRKHSSTSSDYLLSSAHERIEELTKSSLGQLQSAILGDELADQVVKNLVYLAQIVRRLWPDTSETTASAASEKADAELEEDDEEGGDGVDRFGLSWLIGRMARIARREAGNTPQQGRKVRLCFVNGIVLS